MPWIAICLLHNTDDSHRYYGYVRLNEKTRHLFLMRTKELKNAKYHGHRFIDKKTADAALAELLSRGSADAGGGERMLWKITCSI